MLRTVKRPRSLVREVRSKGSFRKAESARLLCRPIEIPGIGSRFSAFSTYPEISSESITSPVEKANEKFSNTFFSLLSAIELVKSMVYVVFSFSVSSSST